MFQAREAAAPSSAAASRTEGTDDADHEHYEIAAYGTAATLAGELDLRKDQTILRQSLDEEKETDIQLTRLATSKINHDALAA